MKTMTIYCIPGIFHGMYISRLSGFSHFKFHRPLLKIFILDHRYEGSGLIFTSSVIQNTKASLNQVAQ